MLLFLAFSLAQSFWVIFRADRNAVGGKKDRAGATGRIQLWLNPTLGRIQLHSPLPANVLVAKGRQEVL